MKSQLLLVGIIAIFSLPHAQGCSKGEFQCLNGKCLYRGGFCNGRNECGDNSDEVYCEYNTANGCPSSWFSCSNKRRCIPSYWRCDGTRSCQDGSDEIGCTNSVEMVPGAFYAKGNLTKWLLQRRKNDSSTTKWGPQVHRIAVALYLANESFFTFGNRIGEEISYEVTIRLMNSLFNSRSRGMTTEELSLSIQALLVTCVDARNFYGKDLVAQLRHQVDTEPGYTNPFAILTLCNAGANITTRDVERVMESFDTKQRPFWTDSQALAAMALSCITDNSSVYVPYMSYRRVLGTLKTRQLKNGTIDNFKTTALVLQALFRNREYKVGFDLEGAVTALVDAQRANGSFGSLLNAYYILPALSYRSLLNISSSHCRILPVGEEEALQDLLDPKGETFVVKYSVWMGDQTDLARSWKIRIQHHKTIYDLLEIFNKLDDRHRLEYNVVEGKPFVTALVGLEDDPELGTYWFVYTKRQNGVETPNLIEKSPSDVEIFPNQEVILWYRRGRWNGHEIVPTTEMYLSTTRHPYSMTPSTTNHWWWHTTPKDTYTTTPTTNQ